MTGSDFWSRRRAAVQAEEEAEEKAEKQAEVAARHAELEEKSDADILAELELPDPDAMAPGDDFSIFMKEVVPDRIRRRALRVLWASNPVLANLDGLVEYGEDYTDAATVVENLQTAYQVGKGMTKHIEEMLRQETEAEDAAIGAAEDDAEDETELAESSGADEPPPEPDVDVAEVSDKNSRIQEATIEPEMPEMAAENGPAPAYFPRKPRRMRYSFDNEHEPPQLAARFDERD